MSNPPLLVPRWDPGFYDESTGAAVATCECGCDTCYWDEVQGWTELTGDGADVRGLTVRCPCCGTRWRLPGTALIEAFVDSTGRYERYVYRPGDVLIRPS